MDEVVLADLESCYNGNCSRCSLHNESDDVCYHVLKLNALNEIKRLRKCLQEAGENR